jgi:hypothetical protein
MTVTIKLTDEQYARISFEKFLEYNGRSADKNSDGTYFYSKTQDMWVTYQVGFRAGRGSASGTCEF